MENFFTVIIFGAFFIGALYSYFFSNKKVVLRALQKAPARSIGEFADGDSGHLMGKVIFAGETLTAPLSGRKCAFYQVVIEEYFGKSWSEIIREEKIADLVIYDGKHYAVVDSKNIEGYLVPDAKYSSRMFFNATPEMKQLLALHGRSSTNSFGMNLTIRYKEGVLEESESISVAGKGYWTEVIQHKLKLPALRILEMRPGDDGLVYLSDVP